MIMHSSLSRNYAPLFQLKFRDCVMYLPTYGWRPPHLIAPSGPAALTRGVMLLLIVTLIRPYPTLAALLWSVRGSRALYAKRYSSSQSYS